MKKTLGEFLERLNESPLNEFAGTGSPAGAAMLDRPDMSGFRGKGASYNFKPRTDAGHEWPYEDDEYMMYGRSMGNKGRDRGDRPGDDQSGGPPTQRYGDTWESGPDNEVEEGADWDETQRHGSDKDRKVWRDTPDGKEWTEMNNEGMGSPGRVGPFAPMDGPQNSSARDAEPVEDENGDAITPQYLPTPYKDMSGPGNMWGGPGTIPGTAGGWANVPYRPEDENDPEKNPMKLREFFDPSPVPVEEIENPEPGYEHDQSDEDVEPDDDHDDFEPHLGGDIEFEPSEPHEEEPGEHGGRLGGMSLNIVGPSSPGGLLTGAGIGQDIVNKSSAWDVLQKVVDAMGKSGGDL